MVKRRQNTLDCIKQYTTFSTCTIQSDSTKFTKRNHFGRANVSAKHSKQTSQGEEKKANTTHAEIIEKWHNYRVIFSLN